MTAEMADEFANELIAVYPASAKLSSWRIARAVETMLDTLDAGEDPIRPRSGNGTSCRPGRGDPRHPPAAGPRRT